MQALHRTAQNVPATGTPATRGRSFTDGAGPITGKETT
jgi:hypothetical protein